MKILLILLLFSTSAYSEEFIGILTELIIDYENSSETKYYLDNKYEVQFIPELNIYINHKVLITGERINNIIHIEEIEVIPPPSSIMDFLFNSANTTDFPFMGTENLLILRGNFVDSKLQNCTEAKLNNVYFNPDKRSVHTIYNEASQGLLNITGEIVPEVFEMPYYSTDPCQNGFWSEFLDEKAIAAGYDLSLYTRRIYTLPNQCGSAKGLAGIGGDQNWIFDCGTTSVAAHELGHNFRMHHATSRSDRGTISEYGDTSDVMSGPGIQKKLNAYHQEALGWVLNNPVITNSGIYTIYGLATNLSKPQILKVFVSGNQATVAEYYYLSYRIPIGLDAVLNAKYLTGINIHKSFDRINSSYKPEMQDKPVLYKVLIDNEEYTDPSNIFTAKQISHTAESVTVKITIMGINPNPPSNIK